jgi:hypothetical protein
MIWMIVTIYHLFELIKSKAEQCSLEACLKGETESDELQSSSPTDVEIADTKSSAKVFAGKLRILCNSQIACVVAVFSVLAFYC